MNRPLLLSILVASTACAAFLLPKEKYESLNVLDQIDIPSTLPGWQSLDISDRINLNDNVAHDDRYNFISDVLARVYRDERGRELLLLVLDAGNFHNPKICFHGSGFAPKDRDDTRFQAGDREFTAHSLLMEKQDGNLLMFYWLCIDKRIVDWTGQKWLELVSSLTRRKKAGLMVRLEIPVRDNAAEQDVAFARGFIATLAASLSPETRDYLFGK
jgi:EpsI family protein